MIAGGKFNNSMILDSFFSGRSLGPVEVYPDDIVSPKEFRGFWIRTSRHKTEVGRENEVQQVLKIFMQYSNLSRLVNRSLEREMPINKYIL